MIGKENMTFNFKMYYVHEKDVLKKLFIISGCDNCEEWYHGDCVNVTEKEAKDIKRYYCKHCQTQNPKLVIVHKSKYKDDKDYHRKRENRREEKKRKREERHKKEAEAEAKGTENSSY